MFSKTTLANELGDFHYISLGSVVRSCQKRSLQERASRLIANAQPWPPELGLDFLKNDICKSFSGEGKVLLDGYPRKEDECEALTNFLRENGLPNVDAYIEVTADRAVLLARYALRQVRGMETRDFFELRYRQYRELKLYLSNMATKLITYNTTNVNEDVNLFCTKGEK